MINTRILRNKLLFEAMNGRLAEQHKEDSSADEKLEEIAQKKRELIRAKTINKSKEQHPISPDEVPFAFPSHWRIVRLEDVTWFGGGHTPSTNDESNYCDNGILWVTSKDMKTDRIYSTQITLTPNGASSLTKYPAGTLIMVTRSGILRRLLPVAILMKEATINQDQKAIVPFDFTMSEWILLYLKACDEFIRQKFGKTGATVESLVFNQVKELPVAIPPLAEQECIVERIKELFSQLSIIDRSQWRYMADARSLRMKILNAGIRGDLTQQMPEDDDIDALLERISGERQSSGRTGHVRQRTRPIRAEEIPFEIPDNWRWVRLADISDTNVGLTYRPTDVTQDGIVVVRSSNIVNGKMDYRDLVRVGCHIKDNQYLYHDDIVICARNGSRALVGKCAIYDDESRGACFGAFMAVLRTALYKYVYYYLQTDAFRRYFTNDDTKQINQVTQRILKDALIPLPPLAEQIRIITKIDELLGMLPI